MTAGSFGGDPYVLAGDEARGWFMTRRGGGHLLDAHLAAVYQQWGPDVSYSLRAPIDPLTGRPSLLIIEVDQPLSDDDSWETLDAVEEQLLNQRAHLSELSRRKEPFANIAITLAVRPGQWEETRRAIEEMA